MYEIAKIIPLDIIQDVLDYGDTAYQYRTGVTTKGKNTYDPSMRKTTGVRIDPKLFPEIGDIIEARIDDGTMVNQFDFLIYNQGDYFKRHRDTFREEHLKYHRIWTTVTLLDKTDDLRGGALQVGDSEPINLQVGETIIFKSNINHEAQKVELGTRKVLVAWLGMYKYS